MDQAAAFQDQTDMAPPSYRPKDRMAKGLAELPETRLPAVEKPLLAIVQQPEALPDSPAWQDLAKALSREFLSDFVATQDHLRDALRLLKIKERSLIEGIEAFYRALRQGPLTRFPRLEEAFQQFRTPAIHHQAVRQFLLQLFVVVINRRIQLLYQVYLLGHPFPDQTTEDERPRHFEPLAPAVHQLLRQANIPAALTWLGFAVDRGSLNGFLMGLNKYHFDPYRINFRFTHHCNIQCAHCYNFSGPSMKAERIATERMLAIVDQMPASGLPNMNLTGGEPFMYLDTVLALVERARRVGVPIISMYTNGFFARREANALKILGQLKQAGFMTGVGAQHDHIKVSAGIYHQEFLAFDVVINLIRAYRQVFDKNIVVDYEVLENRPEVQQEIRKKLSEKGVANQVEIIFRGIAPIGRAAQFDPSLQHTPAGDYGPCGSIDEIVFDPDGAARPCCGMNFENHGIVIGNIGDENLPALLKRLQNNPILQFIARNPMGQLFEHVEGEPQAEGYANVCNLCADAIGGLKDTQDLKHRLAPQQDYFPFWLTAAGAGLG